jgi:hypothetical protein
MISLVKKIFLTRSVVLSSQLSRRNFSLFNSFMQANNEKIHAEKNEKLDSNSDKDEVDWFKNLTNNKHSPSSPSSSLSSSKVFKPIEENAGRKKNDLDEAFIADAHHFFLDIPIEEKKEILKRINKERLESYKESPKVLSNEDINLLLRCETVSHLYKTFIYLAKQEYYRFLKEERRAKLAERRLEKEKLIEEAKNNPDNLELQEKVKTNYPGLNCYLGHVSTKTSESGRARLLNSVMLNEPIIVFDFRYLKMHTRIEILKSMYRQYIEIISINRESPQPFQVYFCNYDSNSEFHQKFKDMLSLDENLIFETEKSYIDLFPRQNLIYLSKDAKQKMISFQPSNIYIIGNIIDYEFEKFRYSSLNQAKIDNIRCESLPIDYYVK